jgi:hypothetical protein
MSAFTTKLIGACKAEYARWDNGAGRETWGTPQHAKDYYLFVKEYWKSVGIQNLDGRTIQGGIRPAWSSALVSFINKSAGAGARFHYTQAHCHYIDRAMKAANGTDGDFGYIARRPDSYKPKAGDIVCAGRQYAAGYDYDQAAMIYEADSFYPSHGDIVIDVTDTHAHVIGGNVNDNVDTKRLKLTSTGYLRNRITSSGRELPWIAILECRI